MIPDFITHYSRGEPFQSLTSVPREQWSRVIQALNETNAWGLNRFQDPDYLECRLEVEKQIRAEFLARGGQPELDQPIYFFLGRHSGFENHSANKGYRINLKDLAPSTLTFTYGDSLLAFNESYRVQSGENYKSPLCAKVFLLNELKRLFSHPHFPQKDPLSIEVQLWIQPTKEIVQKFDRD